MRKKSNNEKFVSLNNSKDNQTDDTKDVDFLVDNDSDKDNLNINPNNKIEDNVNGSSSHSIDDMVFERHDDGSYSIVDKSGNKIYSDEVNLETRKEDFKANKNSSDIVDFEVKHSRDKKTKQKKEKQKEYEKKTLAKKLQTLVVLLILGIFTGSGMGVWYFNTALRSNVDYSQYDPNDYIQNPYLTLNRLFNLNESECPNFVTVAKEQGITPANLSPTDNFVIAQYNATLANSFIGIGNGYVNTLGIEQSVYSSKRYDGTKYTFESISQGMMSVAICDSYTVGANNISIYSGTNITSTSATWNLDRTLDLTSYQEEAGSLPSVIQPYLVSSSQDGATGTVLSESEIIYEEATGLYSFTLELDPVLSIINYAKQVRRTGGLSAYPEFQKITQTIVIDENWNLISIDVSERYSAVAFGMKVTCSGRLKTEFTYNCDVTFPV